MHLKRTESEDVKYIQLPQYSPYERGVCLIKNFSEKADFSAMSVSHSLDGPLPRFKALQCEEYLPKYGYYVKSAKGATQIEV
jgi:hypothetical protein